MKFLIKFNNKTVAASLTIVSNCALIAAKVVIAALSGSVSILSEAIHSGIDLLASLITFTALRLSANPACESYPFGYGKIENISALFEGLLLFAASWSILREAFVKVIYPPETGDTVLSIAVMFFSAVINACLTKYLDRVATKEASIALAADASHLRADAYTSLGVGIGILIMQITGWQAIDSIAAILVAMLIAKEAWQLVKSALPLLLDAALPPEDRVRIQTVLERFRDRIVDYHEIKTRQSGSNNYIDLHITMDQNLTVRESHALGEYIESELKLAIKNATVTIHIDPA